MVQVGDLISSFSCHSVLGHDTGPPIAPSGSDQLLNRCVRESVCVQTFVCVCE